MREIVLAIFELAWRRARISFACARPVHVPFRNFECPNLISLHTEASIRISRASASLTRSRSKLRRKDLIMKVRRIRAPLQVEVLGGLRRSSARLMYLFDARPSRVTLGEELGRPSGAFRGEERRAGRGRRGASIEAPGFEERHPERR